MEIKSPASYDLHLHTYWSYDATAHPESYFQRARELGVKCLAITEHHVLDSAEDLVAIAKSYPEIRVIPAAELSVTTSIGAVDLLCYNLPLRPTGKLAQVLAEYHEWQRAAGKAKSDGMLALGHGYDEAEHQALLRSYRPEKTLRKQGLTHVKYEHELQHFLERGYIKSRAEFSALPSQFAYAAIRPPYPSVQKVVEAVKEAGGLIVMAHPAEYFLQNDRSRMDALREECALDGIECAHPMVDPELSALYRAYCLEKKLLSTAGSDCHENHSIVTPPPHWGYSSAPHFACHIGADEWGEELLERLG